MTRSRRTRLRPVLGPVGLALAVTLVASSCSLLGDDKPEQTVESGSPLIADPTESGLADAGQPTRGGQLVYGLEAEAAKGYCLPESELSISGMQVARALYDTLTVPNAKGGYSPYLAKAVLPSDDHRTWTITLRPGILFHDGTALDAQVVKNNLDAYRGTYPGRSPLLFSFVFKNITAVDVVNELTVRVTTEIPWVAFPAALYLSGRLGIMGQHQLDASTEDCKTKPIGTGPFSFVSWTPDVSLRVKRNVEYWQKAPDDKPYPYLNAIEFRPIPNSDERVSKLEQGEINMMHTSTASDMAGSLSTLRDEGAINLMISADRTEVSYLMFNTSKKPLDERATRVAVANALDRKTLNEKANNSVPQLADGPFAPGVMGHVDDPGFPGFDLGAAKKTVAAMKRAKKKTSFRLLTSDGPVAVWLAELQREMLEAAGFRIDLQIESEPDLISKVIGGDFDLVSFRNQPGEDPDMDHIWWYGAGNPVNFGRFDDPVINQNLDNGRISADEDVRKKAYEAISKQFAKEVWNVWFWYAPWAVAEAANVHGILGPDLPGDGGAPPVRLVTGHSLLGVWIDRP
jgi:peptide/nickel transport system substrate-binding protein